MEEAPEAKEEIPIGIKLMILLICGFIVAFANGIWAGFLSILLSGVFIVVLTVIEFLDWSI